MHPALHRHRAQAYQHQHHLTQHHLHCLLPLQRDEDFGSFGNTPDNIVAAGDSLDDDATTVVAPTTGFNSGGRGGRMVENRGFGGTGGELGGGLSGPGNALGLRGLKQQRRLLENIPVDADVMGTTVIAPTTGFNSGGRRHRMVENRGFAGVGGELGGGLGGPGNEIGLRGLRAVYADGAGTAGRTGLSRHSIVAARQQQAGRGMSHAVRQVMARLRARCQAWSGDRSAAAGGDQDRADGSSGVASAAAVPGMRVHASSIRAAAQLQPAAVASADVGEESR
jgi:hypothetical protein